MAQESAEQKLLKMMNKSSSPVAAKPHSVSQKINFSFSINILNKFLFLGVFVCLLILMWEMRCGFILLGRQFDFSADSRSNASLSEIAMPSAQSVDYYLKSINERNIFKPYVPKSASRPAAQGLVQKMSRYKLVGIAWLDLPETASVMVEDTQKKQTFFLKVGEQLEGVTVKTIYTDRAVFSHENEETTIKL
ncbi:MAG: hypothetical protein HQL14_06455 [Candidatus Omnitrophica bacterium]|nr:hypothetical protein [Candidatus Omnitrophota bacterium]